VNCRLISTHMFLIALFRETRHHEESEKSVTTTAIFIGRWTPKVLFSLKKRPYRHGELRRRFGSISQRMLTKTLRNLESTGSIARHVTRSKSVAVEYSLTHFGSTIIAPLRNMCR